MSTAVLISREEYLHTTYEPDADYVDGVIEERCMGEYDHSSWQDALLAWFRDHSREWNVRARPELRVQVSATRFRVPDVTVMSREQPIEQILTVPPLAVFEILSPEDKITRVLTKLADYEKMGVRTILVIDPATRQFHRYEQGSLELLRDDSVAISGSAARVEWSGVEALLD
jgi:Uma2 family endonuclease